MTKEFNENVDKDHNMDGQVIDEAIVVCNESYIFYYVSIDGGSRALGVNYSIMINNFPTFTCEDFHKRESKCSTYIPCKHMYFVHL